MQKRKTHRGYLPRWVFLRLDRLLVLKRCTYAEHDGLRDAEALVGWTPRLRQPNKTLFAVRCKNLDRQDHYSAF
jgi:hypothetical protein